MSQDFHIDEMRSISEMLEDQQLLLDPASPNGNDQYWIQNYLPLGSSQYVALLDRQVVSYLIEAISAPTLIGHPADIRLRQVAGLQAFLSATNTISEPGLAYNEYADTQGLLSADSELSKFRTADELSFYVWRDLAESKRDYVLTPFLRRFSTGQILAARRNDRVMHFEYNLTIVKKALLIKLSGNSGCTAMLELLDWMHSDYLSTTPSIFFFALYFSEKRVSGMLKGSSDKEARNAAWDICFLQQWRSNETGIECNRMFLATFDRALRLLATLMFPKEGEFVDDYMSGIREFLIDVYGRRTGNGRRVYERFIRLQKEVDDPSRAHNQEGNKNNHDFVLQVRATIDEEFSARAAV